VCPLGESGAPARGRTPVVAGPALGRGHLTPSNTFTWGRYSPPPPLLAPTSDLHPLPPPPPPDLSHKWAGLLMGLTNTAGTVPGFVVPALVAQVASR
jgi:hypothetical protein